MTKEEILKSKEKFIWFTKEEESVAEFNEHFKKYDFFQTKTPNVMGQYFLYETFKSLTYDSSQNKYTSKLSYPKLAVYLNSLPCDQTIEVEFVNYRRTWEWRTEYDYQYDGKNFKNYIAEIPTGVDRLILWGDSMLIYGCWDSMPNWKQLRQAYERTWWFHRTKDELRDIQLERIFGNG